MGTKGNIDSMSKQFAFDAAGVFNRSGGGGFFERKQEHKLPEFQTVHVRSLYLAQLMFFD